MPHITGCLLRAKSLRERTRSVVMASSEHETAVLGEMSKVFVSCDELDVVIDAGLRCQRIAQSRFEAEREYRSPGKSGALPVAIGRFELSYLGHERCQRCPRLVITQQLAYHDRWKAQASIVDRGCDGVRVGTLLALKKRDKA